MAVVEKVGLGSDIASHAFHMICFSPDVAPRPVQIYIILK